MRLRKRSAAAVIAAGAGADLPASHRRAGSKLGHYLSTSRVPKVQAQGTPAHPGFDNRFEKLRLVLAFRHRGPIRPL